MKSICYFLVLLSQVFSQPSPANTYELPIQKAIDEIRLDGVLDENSWKKAAKADGFWQKWPNDQHPAPQATEAWATYDDQFLYFAVVAYGPEEYIIQTLKRDVDPFSSDGIAVMLDPVNRKTNGFFFSVSALGVQSEALISPEITEFEDFTTDWDNKWFSVVKNHPDRYVVEIAIPFKTLRYESGKTRWGINIQRNDLKNNSYSTWRPVPVNFFSFDLGYMGTMIWDNPPKKVKGNVSIIPYVRGGVSKDFEAETDASFLRGLGSDAKIALSSSLNLDLTINPDFSQVDVDQQVTNLERFSLFFPERRQFFLENSDLFNNFGIPPTRPFFSRRIGLRNGLPVPILFGARLSGNLDKNWRIGLMNMQTAQQDDLNGQNYTVGAFQRRVWKRSNISGILINRQGFDGSKIDPNDYGRNAGLEFNFSTNDGQWNGWFQGHTSFSPEQGPNRNYVNVGGMHNSRNLSTVHSFSHTGRDYIVDIGFNARQFNYDAARDSFLRVGYQILFQEFNYRFFPKDNQTLTRHGPKIQSVAFFNTHRDARNKLFNEWNLMADYQFFFQGFSILNIGVGHNEVNLPFATRLLSDLSFDPLPVDHYSYTTANLTYISDSRKPLNLIAQLSLGQFYNGSLSSSSLTLNYRKQPWGNIALSANRNAIRLPEAYGEETFWLIGPKIEINFSRSLFWTTFLQYNTQIDNFNINSRLQWRFKPMSDIFLVYSDNYAVETLGVKNRAIVLKLNYWLTL
ncbi:MAG: DUF5916 domain-containing protein [Bacteroidota bacterium]